MRQWDWFSLFLYLVIGTVFVLLIYIAEKKGSGYNKYNVKKYNSLGRINYFFLFIILVFFASFRYIGNNIGGIDAPAYINSFLNAEYYSFNIINILTLKQQEPLFYILAYIFRKFTDNYIVFFSFIYGIIFFCYLRFISIQYEERMSLLPFICIILPYLYSFNTMRSSIAIAVSLLAFNAFSQRNKSKFIFYLVIAALFHYTALIIIIFYLFYKFMSIKMINRKSIAILSILIIYLVFFVGKPLISSVINNTKYFVYIDQENSFLGQLIIILCGFFTILFFKDLKQRMQHKSIFLWAVIFNVSMIPVMMFFGFFRLNDYFAFPRLITWGYIIIVIKDKLKLKFGDRFLPLYYFIVILTIFSWTIFRISQDWYPNGVMPYMSIFRNN